MVPPGQSLSSEDGWVLSGGRGSNPASAARASASCSTQQGREVGCRLFMGKQRDWIRTVVFCAGDRSAGDPLFVARQGPNSKGQTKRVLNKVQKHKHCFCWRAVVQPQHQAYLEVCIV